MEERLKSRQYIGYSEDASNPEGRGACVYLIALVIMVIIGLLFVFCPKKTKGQNIVGVSLMPIVVMQVDSVSFDPVIVNTFTGENCNGKTFYVERVNPYASDGKHEDVYVVPFF